MVKHYKRGKERCSGSEDLLMVMNGPPDLLMKVKLANITAKSLRMATVG